MDKDIKCTKCGSNNLYLEPRGTQVALICKDCGSWIKWVAKKDVKPLEAILNKRQNNEQAKLKERKNMQQVFLEKQAELFERIGKEFEEDFKQTNCKVSKTSKAPKKLTKKQLKQLNESSFTLEHDDLNKISDCITAQICMFFNYNNVKMVKSIQSCVQAGINEFMKSKRG